MQTLWRVALSVLSLCPLASTLALENVPKSRGDCYEYPNKWTFIDKSYQDPDYEVANILECLSYLDDPAKFWASYNDRTPLIAESESDCQNRTLVRRMYDIEGEDVSSWPMVDKERECRAQFWHSFTGDDGTWWIRIRASEFAVCLIFSNGIWMFLLFVLIYSAIKEKKSSFPCCRRPIVPVTERRILFRRMSRSNRSIFDFSQPDYAWVEEPGFI